MDEMMMATSQETFKTKWNWGSFMMSFQFAVGTKAYLGLLSLIPLLNIVWVFISGGLGEKWALKSGQYRDNEEFRKVMDSWNRAGLVMFIIFAIFMVLYFALFGALISAIMSYSSPEFIL